MTLKSLQRACAEIQRGFHQRVINTRQRRIDRQHHKRQIGIDNPDIHRKVGVQDRQRLVDDPKPQQEVIQYAVILQDPHPRVHADQERRPRR